MFFLGKIIAGMQKVESLDMMTAFEQWVSCFSYSEFITEKAGTVI